MGLIYRNDFTSVRVPSSTELAEKFSVTRRTARMALEGLISEGYLIGRKGIGTFTNPKVGFLLPGAHQRKLIAIGSGKCNNFYYDLRIGKMYASLLNNICEAGYNVHALNNMPDDPAAFARALAGINPDGIIMYDNELAPEALDEYLKSGKPCVNIRPQYTGTDYMSYDYTPAYRRLLTEMREKGKSFLVLFNHEQHEEKLIQAIKEVHPECRYNMINSSASENRYYTDLEELFANPEKTPDYLVCSWRAPEVICDLREKYGVSPERCRAIADGDYVYSNRYQGGYFAPDKDETARTAIMAVRKRWQNPNDPPQELSVPIRYIKEKKTDWLCHGVEQ